MFDELRAINVSHKDRCHEWLINLLHEIDGMLALRSDHDAIRMHQIRNCTAFAQKFGIAHNIKFRTVAIVALDRFSYFLARLYRHRALVNNYPIVGQYRCDLARDFLEKTKIDIAIRLLGSGNGDKNDL